MVDRTGSVAGTVRDCSGHAGTVFWLQEGFLVAGICLISYLVVLWAETEGIPPLLLSGSSIGVQFLMSGIWLKGKERRKADCVYFSGFDYSAGLSVHFPPV